MSLFARHCCARVSVMFGTSPSFGILSAQKSLWNKFIFLWPNQKPTPVVTEQGAKLASLCSFKTSPFLSTKAAARKSVKKKKKKSGNLEVSEFYLSKKQARKKMYPVICSWGVLGALFLLGFPKSRAPERQGKLHSLVQAGSKAKARGGARGLHFQPWWLLSCWDRQL